MGKHNVGAKNGVWRGGRTVASNGYVLVRVGKGHHLADVRGYAYEHRVVAERLLGRRLQPDELVHHRDHDKQNNDESNLEVMPRSWHHVEHRRTARGRSRRLPGQPNPVVSCACGCGERFLKFDEARRPRRFISGHNIHPRASDGR